MNMNNLFNNGKLTDDELNDIESELKKKINELENELEKDTKEVLKEQDKELKPMRLALIGLLRSKMMMEVDEFIHNGEDFNHLHNIKLILEIIQLLKLENEPNNNF